MLNAQKEAEIKSLRKAGRKEMMTWSSFRRDVPIAVIPCCADMSHFSLTDASQKRQQEKCLVLKKLP